MRKWARRRKRRRKARTKSTIWSLVSIWAWVLARWDTVCVLIWRCGYISCYLGRSISCTELCALTWAWFVDKKFQCNTHIVRFSIVVIAWFILREHMWDSILLIIQNNVIPASCKNAYFAMLMPSAPDSHIFFLHFNVG
jgi:hypothetical protein